jgi:hypothetical protein
VDARRFGEALGVAFQLQDDSAGGGWGRPETLGKAPNDLEERKRSLPVVLAGQANPTTVAALLATTGEPATVELLEVLDDLAIRPFGKLSEGVRSPSDRTPPRAQALAREAAGEALRALKDLQLKPPWEGRSSSSSSSWWPGLFDGQWTARQTRPSTVLHPVVHNRRRNGLRGPRWQRPQVGCCVFFGRGWHDTASPREPAPGPPHPLHEGWRR